MLADAIRYKSDDTLTRYSKKKKNDKTTPHTSCSVETKSCKPSNNQWCRRFRKLSRREKQEKEKTPAAEKEEEPLNARRRETRHKQQQ
jgi:hypothetical protein